VPSPAWLLLLYTLPAKQSAARLSLWRQLKRLGAVSLKTSAYVMPDSPAHLESLQWVGQQVREQGGEASLLRVAEIDGMTEADVKQLFQSARTADYDELLARMDTEDDAGRLASRYEAIRRIDFFNCETGHRVAEKLDAMARRGSGRPAVRSLKTAHYQGRTWLTRPRPEVDRVGSAWLIARFIDQTSRFVFGTHPDQFPGALPYDMVDVEFGHHGDACTFETLAERFTLRNDPGVVGIAAIIHDADLTDGKFGRQEGLGLLAIFRGWAAIGWPDERILEQGFACFDGLYQSLGGTRQAKS